MNVHRFTSVQTRLTMQKNYTEIPILTAKKIESEDIDLVLGDSEDQAVFEILDSETWLPKEQTIQNILKCAKTISE